MGPRDRPPRWSGGSAAASVGLPSMHGRGRHAGGRGSQDTDACPGTAVAQAAGRGTGRLLLAVPEKADDVMVRSAAATFARVRPGASIHLLTSDGRLVPLPSIGMRRAPMPIAANGWKLIAAGWNPRSPPGRVASGPVRPRKACPSGAVAVRPPAMRWPTCLASWRSFDTHLRGTRIANGEDQASDLANGDRQHRGSPPEPAPHPDGTRVIDPREWPFAVPVPNDVVIEDQVHRAADGRDEDGTASIEGRSGSTEPGHHGAHRWPGVSGVDPTPGR